MAYRFQVSSQAWRDLRDIIATSEKRIPRQLTEMAAKLLSRAELLASFPYLGRKIRGRPGGRVLVEGSIQIIYRIERDTVRIIRFWHSARNPDSLESD
jgi:plasmid stabilization system protein ParE